MWRVLFACVLAAVPLYGALSPRPTLAQGFRVPRDGMFSIEARPSFTFKATLTEDWICPHAGAGTLTVYAPVLPELPGQRKVATRLFLMGNDKLKATAVKETSVSKRPMLVLHIHSDELSPRTGIRPRVEYKGTLFARTLKLGRPRRKVPDLSKDEKQRYLMTSVTMDHEAPEFRRWMNDQGLKRRQKEQAMPFGHRVFTYLIKKATYGGNTSSYEARRPTRVCKSLANDCGGLALLFVAVMRANGVPARTLFGRWALPQTDAYGQYHVMAEFFVNQSGWVPVDISGTIVHKPANAYAFFGNTDGQHLAFHLDTDMEPTKDFRHAWAQYLLLQWRGTGDFWKEHRVTSKWDVTRRAAGK